MAKPSRRAPKIFQTSTGLEKLWEFIRHLNKYIDTNKPWQLAKDGNTALLSSVMRNLLEAIYLLCTAMSLIGVALLWVPVKFNRWLVDVAEFAYIKSFHPKVGYDNVRLMLAGNFQSIPGAQ